MRRLSRLLLPGLASIAVLVAAGSGSAAGAGSAPRAALRRVICQHALDPSQRSVAVTAVMRPLAGTRRMELRFELFRRDRNASSYAVVRGGDLDTWISPEDASLGQRPGDVWILNKQVVGLAAPARYRFRVQFRWTGSHHRVLRTVSRSSSGCQQPELRPDLVVRGVTVYLTHKPGVNRYVAVIGNQGASAAGRFQVSFSGGGGVQTHTVGHLAAHSTTTVQFRAAACSSSSPPTVTADPQHQVDDFDRANNAEVVSCSGIRPAPSGPAGA